MVSIVNRWAIDRLTVSPHGEIVIDGKTGALADVGDPMGLAYQVKKVLADKELQQEFTKNARAHIQAFSYQRTAEKTKAIYEEVLDSVGR